jgi:hypothetical protein
MLSVIYAECVYTVKYIILSIVLLNVVAPSYKKLHSSNL